MSLLEKNKIDFIGLIPSGGVELTIADEQDWQDVNLHLLQMQDKMNSYIAFIESEEIYLKYPNAIGQELRIHIRAKHDLPLEVMSVYKKLNSFLWKSEIKLMCSIGTGSEKKELFF